MDIRSCPECGKVYVDTGAGLCLDCLKQDEKDFDVIHKFLEGNPHVSVDFACSETGIEKEKILKFLRQGRLLQSKMTGVELRCSVCGGVILSGNLCGACVKRFQGVADDLAPDGPNRQSGRMHTFDHIKKR